MYDLPKAKKAIDKYLRKKEGERLKPYLCTAGKPTIGVGATTYPDGRAVTLQDPPITVERMNEMLAFEIERYTNAVLKMVNRVCTTSQLVAFVMLGYNVGLGALAKSTAVRKHNEGDYAAAAKAFLLFDKVRNPYTKKLEQSPPILARRVFESAVYMADNAALQPMAQAVEPESNLRSSPITQASTAVTAAGGLVAALPEAPTPAVDAAAAALPAGSSLPEAVNQGAGWLAHIQQAAQTFSVSPTTILGLVIVAAGVWALYWRLKQRDGGHA